jgi:D-alanyl-D-alanine carboxypeptidase
VLLNTERVEAWPGGLLRARGNHDARLLAGAGHVLRRKRDGAYLAVERAGELQPLRPRFAHEPGVAEAIAAIAGAGVHRRNGIDVVPALPLARLQQRLDALGLDADAYAARTGLVLVAEPAWLALAGFDRYDRPLWLRSDAARAWTAMQAGALRDGIVLEAIPARLARARGNATARALAGADWLLRRKADGRFLAVRRGDALQAHAGEFGFEMSYPRGNPHGIDYEPWHWRLA